MSATQDKAPKDKNAKASTTKKEQRPKKEKSASDANVKKTDDAKETPAPVVVATEETTTVVAETTTTEAATTTTTTTTMPAENDAKDSKKNYYKDDPEQTVESIQKLIQKLKSEPVHKPNEEDLKKKIATIRQKIEQLQEQANNSRTAIIKERASAAQFEMEKDKVFEVINQFNDKIRDKNQEKDAIQVQVKSFERDRDELREKLHQIEKDLGTYKNEAQINKKIKELENKIQTETNHKTRENGLVAAVNKLEKSKESLKKYDELQQSLTDRIEAAKDILHQFKQKQGEIRQLYDQRQVHYDQANDIKVKRKKSLDSANAMQKKQDQLRKQTRECFEQIDDEKAKFKKLQDANRNYLRQLQREEEKLERKKDREQKKKYFEQKKERDEKRKEFVDKKLKERESIAKEWEEYNELVRQNPYEKEITMCESLIHYVEQLSKKNSKNQNSIKHPIDKFNAFNHLSIVPPTSFDKLGSVVKAIKQKLTYYKTNKVDKAVTQVDNSFVATSAEPVKLDAQFLPTPAAATTTTTTATETNETNPQA